MKLKSMKLNSMKLQIIGLLTIVVLLWIVLYLIPEIMVSLFDTLLGNLLLTLIVLLSYTNNRYLGIGIGLLFVIVYRFVALSKSKEGFTDKSARDFLTIQSTINPQKSFDMKVLSTQASQEELDYFNTYKIWPWSIPTIELYQESIRRNPYVRVDAHDATNYARTIYNEEAILRVLYNQSDEANFLLNGVLVKGPNSNPYEELPSGFGSFPYESGLKKDTTYDVIKCSMKNEANPTLERIQYTGRDGIFGAQTEKRTPVDYHSLESIIPGFRFEDKPCNPCSTVATMPNYSCKFSINLKDDNTRIL